MSVFRSIVFTAAAAGLIVGLVTTGAQHVGTLPLIMKAEVYEQQAEAARPAEAAPAPAPQVAPAHGGHDHAAHDHGGPAWEPTPGLERNAYTALFNVLEWIGFGLLLSGAIVLFRRAPTWREGLMWGLAGFAAFVLAPGLGLPPELPGVPAADLMARQVWWAGTALATAVGLGLIGLNRTALGSLAGAVLIVVPHLIGAPRLESVETTVPELLSHRFVVVMTVTTFASWALLGVLTGVLLRRFTGPDLQA